MKQSRYKRKKITYDELFKHSFKFYFSKRKKLSVITDFELLKLPKRFDILIIRKNKNVKLTFFNYFKEYNIISYKSLDDRLTINDIYDLYIYYYGYLKNEKSANLRNTTISIITTYKPKKILEELQKTIKKIEKGVYEIESGLIKKVRLIIINKLVIENNEEKLLLLSFSSEPKRKEMWEYIKEEL